MKKKGLSCYAQPGVSGSNLKISLDRSTVACVKPSSETCPRLSRKPLCYTWISDVDVFTDAALVRTSLS